MIGDGFNFKLEAAIKKFAEITQFDEAYAESVLKDVNYDLETALAGHFSSQVADSMASVAALTSEIKLIDVENDVSQEKLFENTNQVSWVNNSSSQLARDSVISLNTDATMYSISGIQHHSRWGRLCSDQSYGIIVRQEQDYAVIWSVDFGLVCAPSLGCREKKIGDWVSFKTFDDFNLTVEGGQLNKSTYEVKDIPPKRLCYKCGGIVKCRALVRMMPRTGNESFQMVKDDVFGVILCSYDPYLIKKLKQGSKDDEVEILVIYMENYQRSSSWIGIGVNRGENDWRKLERLPERVDVLAKKAFLEIRHMEANESMLAKKIIQGIPDTDNRPLYYPPKDWQGVVQISERKISEVLGVVFGYEANESVSLIYTIFGLARFPAYLELGTWLKMTICEDTEETTYPNFSAVARSSYHVRQSATIPPPVSTRVITVDGCDRLLLCGIVTYLGPRCYSNPYLGKVFDKKHKILLNSETSYTSGFLVEFSIFIKNFYWYWNILKCHGSATSADDSHVPLEMSVFPDYLGRVYKDQNHPAATA